MCSFYHDTLDRLCAEEKYPVLVCILGVVGLHVFGLHVVGHDVLGDFDKFYGVVIG